MLQGIFDYLNIPAGELALRLHLWGSRTLKMTMDPNYVSLLNMLRDFGSIETIDPGWLHTRYNPINSPGRGGGGKAGGGGGNALAH
jgi:hypothetical protein